MQSGIYFLDQNGLGYHSKLGLYRTKNSSGHDFDSHTHAYTPHTSKNSSDFGHYKIQIVYNVKIKLTFPKIGGPEPPPWIRHWFQIFTMRAEKNAFVCRNEMNDFVIYNGYLYVLALSLKIRSGATVVPYMLWVCN